MITRSLCLALTLSLCAMPLTAQELPGMTLMPDDLGLGVLVPPPLPTDSVVLPDAEPLQGAVSELAETASVAAMERPSVQVSPPENIPASVLQGIRPRMRGDTQQENTIGVRPRARSEQAESDASETPVQPPAMLRPFPRPDLISNRAAEISAARRRGMVCDRPDLQGEHIGAVPGAGGCGIAAAVRLKSVSGIRLSQPALLDCQTARVFGDWVQRGLRPAVMQLGETPSEIRVAASYACRTRNSQRGARLSEHARGKAIDIYGVRFAGGGGVTVLNGWNTAYAGATLQKMHRSACGLFGTVLGPNADRFHQDHFHFDTASYRSGAYCR